MRLKRARIESILSREWLRRGALATMLWPLSLFFHALVSLRRRMYASGMLKSEKIDRPVIVVGNIFIGGTGKTPFTIWLVQRLQQAGYKPGVISRGYLSQDEKPRPVFPSSDPQQAGDEPVLIASRTRCPVMVGRKRVETARALLEGHPEVNVIVSDDGLQHYALARDLEIMLFDARGTGNGWMLPAGPLREPASRRCDFAIVNLQADIARFEGSELHRENAYPMHLVPGLLHRLEDATLTKSLKALGDAARPDGHLRIVAAAGIGNPARFFSMLKSAGLVFDELPLPDHYAYQDNPFHGLRADIILITEKDAVKCRQIEHIRLDPRIWVVPVTADIDDVLATKILERVRGSSIA
ncbi:tetraacyldisaccharide 4'-kinase [Oxalobacteraceae bacterium R-40]|uniref:Tetraacyldisaccharide 4'-kinase n=1 Tax=Keguizhuia sedimenti TaxID=3064264 RepID=A0ABU1BLI7_9BURK|nr:tetraacyldisaccharide 4'-kinase [Oxalobacteraceae bacterium R-40]